MYGKDISPFRAAEKKIRLFRWLIRADISSGDQGQLQKILMILYLRGVDMIPIEPSPIKRGMFFCIPYGISDSLLDKRIQGAAVYGLDLPVIVCGLSH
jgi:hypothetical protein